MAKRPDGSWDYEESVKKAKGGVPRSYSQQIKDNLAKTAKPTTAKTTSIPVTPAMPLQSEKFMPK